MKHPSHIHISEILESLEISEDSVPDIAELKRKVSSDIYKTVNAEAIYNAISRSIKDDSERAKFTKRWEEFFARKFNDKKKVLLYSFALTIDLK